eukprot:924260-Alexandrium_andersonii.AAC.1
MGGCAQGPCRAQLRPRWKGVRGAQQKSCVSLAEAAHYVHGEASRRASACEDGRTRATCKARQ